MVKALNYQGFELLVFGFLCEECVNELVDIAVYYALDVAGLHLGAVVLNQLIGHEDVGADLTAPFDLVLYALDIADLFKVFALLDFGKAGSQHVLAVLQVLEVASLNLACNNDAGGQVGQTNCGRGLVDLLTACAGSAVNVHLDVLVAQLNGAVVLDLGHDLNGREGSLAAAQVVKGGDAYEAVDTVLTAEEVLLTF